MYPLKRITVQISDPVLKELQEYIPWGQRRHAIEAVLKLIIEAVKKDGHLILGMIMDGKFKLVPTTPQEDEDDDRPGPVSHSGAGFHTAD